MIQSSLELIDAGGDNHWDLISRFARNQLAENQIKDGCFISEDNSREDADGHTWKNLSKRVVGGWSGGAEPNSISLARFRSVAGCCIGTAPQALWMVYSRIVEEKNGEVYINMPIERDSDAAKVEIGYPNDGYIEVKAKRPGAFKIRAFDWMGASLSARKNGALVQVVYDDGCVVFPDVKKDDILRVSHPLHTVVKNEMCMDVNLTVKWRGPDVVEMSPKGAPLRLYQRIEGAAREYPRPIAAKSGAAVMSMAPTNQKY
jgi:hypothetical protein